MDSRERMFRIEAYLIAASLFLLVTVLSLFDECNSIKVLELIRAANGFLVIYTLDEKKKHILLASVAIGIGVPLLLLSAFSYNTVYCLLDVAFFLIWWLYSKGIQQSALRVLIVAALRSYLPLLVCFIGLVAVAFKGVDADPLILNLSYFCNSLACSLAFYHSYKTSIHSKLYGRKNNNGGKSTMKNHTTALLLSVLLGCLGVDRFYLGYMGMGIVKLLTGGCFGIVWIYDIVMIATNQLLPADGSSYQSISKSYNTSNNMQDVASALEKLAKLHQQGILSDEEFNRKKAELLAKM